MSKEHIKIRYAQGERGWAVDLGDGKAEIANLPLADLNFGDTVTLTRDEDGMRLADKVLARKWEKKSALRYLAPFRETFAKIQEALQVKRGWPVEGGIPGLCMVCHPANADLAAVLLAAGVEGVRVEGQPLREVVSGLGS